jgi:hypothetical protein
MKRHGNKISLGIAFAVLGLVALAYAAGNDTNQACSNGTMDCNSNRPISTPIWAARVAFPTAAGGANPTPNTTPLAVVTPMTAGTPGPARGCYFATDPGNPQQLCLGANPSQTGSGCPGGRSWCCTSGIPMPPGAAVYQPAPNGDCGLYKFAADQMPTGINVMTLEIDPVP